MLFPQFNILKIVHTKWILSFDFPPLFSPFINKVTSDPRLSSGPQAQSFNPTMSSQKLANPASSLLSSRPVLFELYLPLSLTTTVFQVRFTHLSTCYHATKANLFNSLLSICHEISITKSTQSQLSLNSHAPHVCIICSLCLDRLWPNF